MRTTLTIDDDVLGLARSLAEARGISVGAALSFLARRGAAARSAISRRNGFHVFTADPQAPRFGPDDVKTAVEAEDLGCAPSFWKPAR